MICLSCTGKTLEEDLLLFKKNREYIGMVEIRADFLAAEELRKLKYLPSGLDLPCILTFRKPEDGGVTGPGVNPEDFCRPEKRCGILSEALEGDWAFLDLEEDAFAECETALKKKAEKKGIKIIISFHDFDGVPDGLAERILENSCGDRYVSKAAVMVNSSADLLKLFDAYKRLEYEKKQSAGFSCTNGSFVTDYILVGMGPAGLPSRVLAGSMGSFLSYCSDGDAVAAPGHISPRELSEVYNYENLQIQTRLFGIVGQPVMHSKSPVIHNRVFREQKIDAVYLPFETSEPELFMSRAEELRLDGLSVTIPHKQRVIRAADETDDAVEKIGACNTLVRRNGRWEGYNTDWKGFLAPLDLIAAEGIGSFEKTHQGGDTLVIGAGGAARAVVYALLSRGADVTVVNRTAENAEKLAAEFGCRGFGFDAAHKEGLLQKHWRLAVQTTSVGMAPDQHRSPLPDLDFRNIDIAYDIVYVPEKTIFLEQAEEAGCLIINGLPMLKAQAAEQFRLFSGREK